MIVNNKLQTPHFYTLQLKGVETLSEYVFFFFKPFYIFEATKFFSNRISKVAKKVGACSKFDGWVVYSISVFLSDLIFQMMKWFVVLPSLKKTKFGKKTLLNLSEIKCVWAYFSPADVLESDFKVI